MNVQSMAGQLATKRLVLVTGKGGVGKSTCAAAIAVAAARARKNVLHIELGARSVAGELIGGSQPTHEPSLIAADRLPTLWVCHLDERRALQEYLLETLRLKSLVKLATENRVLARLWQAAPSVDEMSILNAIYRFERELSTRGEPKYDLVIVDMPSTGHAFSMLGVPRGAIAMIRGSALAVRAHDIDVLLHDAAKTAVCIVTLPEELPVNESVQLVERLQRELAIVSTHVLINGVTADLFNAAEHASLAELAPREGPERRLMDTVRRRMALVALQARRIDDLRTRLQARFAEVAWMQARGRGLVDTVADALSVA